MPIMKSGNQLITEGVELPNQKAIRTIGEKETYKYLGILEADTIKQQEMKEKKFKKEYLRRVRKSLEWGLPLVRYSGPFLKLTREELKKNDQ